MALCLSKAWLLRSLHLFSSTVYNISNFACENEMWRFYKFESCQFYRKKKDIENENFWSDDLRVGYGWNSWIRQRRRKIYETGDRLLCRSPPFTSRYKLNPIYRVFHKFRFSSIISVYRTLKKFNLSPKTSWGNLDSRKFCDFYEIPITLNDLRNF